MTIEGVVATVSPELNIVEVAADHIKAELRQEFDPKRKRRDWHGGCMPPATRHWIYRVCCRIF